MMHAMAVAGAVLILAAVLITGMGGWGMPGPWTGPGGRPDGGGWYRWMPHMGRGWNRSGGTGTAQPPVAGAPSVAVDLVDFGIRPLEIRVKAGQPVNLALANRGRILHDLTIPAVGFQAVVQPGQRTAAALTAPASGTYDLYCSVPGHREAGMTGRLVVAP
jgi:heme/copper-type cytochrome/quinol oxidase subunit 2